jgi:hypothetical protein
VPPHVRAQHQLWCIDCHPTNQIKQSNIQLNTHKFPISSRTSGRARARPDVSACSCTSRASRTSCPAAGGGCGCCGNPSVNMQWWSPKRYVTSVVDPRHHLTDGRAGQPIGRHQQKNYPKEVRFFTLQFGGQRVNLCVCQSGNSLLFCTRG